MKNTVLLTILMFGMVEVIHAQEKNPLKIDLGVLDPGEIYSYSQNENITYDCILLQNVIVGYKYSIKIEKAYDTLPVLKFQQNSPNGLKDVSCKELSEAINNVYEMYKESTRNLYIKNHSKELPEKELAKRINKLFEVSYKNSCQDSELKGKAEELIKQSYRHYYEKIILRTGETVTIKIKRDSLEWTYIIKGKQLGQWVTTYGFGFTSSALEKKTYYTKQAPLTDTSKYQILKSRKAGGLDLNYVPAVFFSFFPSQKFNKCLNHSLTAGLGFDLSAPVVFFGYSLMFWQNIGLSAGVVFQQQFRLKNQYSENEFVPVSLEKDQLHDKVYRPNLFLSINFRFGESPFKTNSTGISK